VFKTFLTLAELPLGRYNRPQYGVSNADLLIDSTRAAKGIVTICAAPSKDDIINESAVPGFRRVFVIGHGASQVAVYSQQVRALNLIWALNQENPLNDKDIVVVGGGIAGVTATAAALLYGANVTLLERGEELLHLQRGCHTRYLHPHIFQWPDPIARRAGAGLPILDWSVGTASEVANRILADFHRIRLLAPERYNEQTSARDMGIVGDGEYISWRGREVKFGEKQKQMVVVRPRAIILALGFGIEKTVGGLPRRSYWRVDSLTQTALDSEDDPYVVLVSGTGDGGIIDVLRAKLKEFDHGGFLDECVLRLEDGELHEKIKGIEEAATAKLKRGEIESQLSLWLEARYAEIRELGKLDHLLSVVRARTHVIWTGPLPRPVSLRSQRLNRLLGWRRPLLKRLRGVGGPEKSQGRGCHAPRVAGTADRSGDHVRQAVEERVAGHEAQQHLRLLWSWCLPGRDRRCPSALSRIASR
jgi:hypothetical protein